MSPDPKERASLWRYTNLPSLLHILNQRELTLLDPGSWDDSNDAYTLTRYRTRIKAGSVLALCFSVENDTYHHWNIFSGKDSGVRIEFDRHRLLASLSGKPSFRHGQVDYRKITDVTKDGIKVEDLPFIKRYPYQAEQEYRIIYQSKAKAMVTKALPIELSWIRRITINPWMPKPLSDITRATIKKIEGCENLKVYRSTVTDNARWKKAADRAR